MSSDGLHLGFTGVAGRAGSLLGHCLEMEDVTIAAVCDPDPDKRAAAVDRIADAGRPAPRAVPSHEELVAGDDLEAVIIATPWDFHVPFAIEAMEAGVDVGFEVGPAASIEQCHALVRTAERTGQRCMLLENCCYHRDVLAVARMDEAGLFGELVHCRCGYGHDLRPGLVRGDGSPEDRADTRTYRGIHHERRNGDLYPTHGLGPIAKLLDINRGNRFVSLTATASRPAGLADWADRNLPADHPVGDVEWRHGDVVTTSIRCAGGETILVTHDVSLPRPYSLMYQVQGTRGRWHGELDAIYLDEESPEHEWEDFEPYREQWEHPIWDAYADRGVRDGHGGIDFLTLRAFVETMAGDRRPPIDVYDAAAWRAITPLSAQSIARGGAAVSVPDFTDGAWMTDDEAFPGVVPRV